LDIPMPVAPTAKERAYDILHENDDSDFEEMNQPGPFLRGSSERNDANSNSISSHNSSTKLVRADECMLVMAGEELEVGDKVEVCPPDSFLYCVGYIWMIHRKFDANTSSVVLTYDVHMEGTGASGEAIGSHHHDTIENRIQLYSDKLRNNESTEEWDVEYDVEPKNIRKLLSGRIKATDRWRSAWRKVTTMLAFKTGGLAFGERASSGSSSGGV